jgi:hypothetical protein
MKMTTQFYQEGCSEFLEQFFATSSPYKKFDSEGNRTAIVDRMASYQLPPSATAVRRACLELEGEGAIERADGGDAESDAIQDAQDAEARDRQAALAQPLTQNDVRLYSSLSQREISQRCADDRVFRFRYEAACKLWGFQMPRESAPASQVPSEIPQEIADKIRLFEAGKISTYEFRLACKSNRVLRDAYEQYTGLALMASPGR